MIVSMNFASAVTAGRKIGVGVMLGDPTALSGKFFTGNHEAFDANLAFSHDSILLFGDYLHHFPGKFGRKNEFIAALTPYVGVGPVFAFNDDNDRGKNDRYFGDEDDDFALGGRIPLGIEWMIPEFPVGLSVEIAPGLIVLPVTDGFIHASLIARYYF